MVRRLPEEYSDVLTDIPGKTNLAECNIELTEYIPFRVKAYPVPYALKKEMNKKLTEMMNVDIIVVTFRIWEFTSCSKEAGWIS